MQFNKSVLLIALVFVFGVGTRAHEHETKVSPAAPARAGSSSSSVRLGDKLVVITSPAGFEEAGSQCPKFKELLIATEDPSNDVLFGHLSPSDCQALRNGGQATMNLYTKVSVLRSAHEQAISSADIAAIAVEIRKNGAAILPHRTQHAARSVRRTDGRAKLHQGAVEVPGTLAGHQLARSLP